MHLAKNPAMFASNQYASDNPSESLGAWESEERARNFIESGYSGYSRKGFRANWPTTGSGLNSQIVNATWGHSVDVYEENIRREFADCADSPRIFRKALIGPESSGPEYMNGQQFVALYSAVSYANSLGLVMNVHISITWGMLGIHCQHEAAKVLRYEFFKHLQEWCEYRLP